MNSKPILATLIGIAILLGGLILIILTALGWWVFGS